MKAWVASARIAGSGSDALPKPDSFAQIATRMAGGTP